MPCASKLQQSELRLDKHQFCFLMLDFLTK